MSKLDNPAWYSLQEAHEHLGIDFGNIKFYQPDYCPFGGFVSKDNIASGIDQYAAITHSFYTIGEQPTISGNLHITKNVKCLQMVLNHRLDIVPAEQIVTLGPGMASQLFALVNLVQPGYVKPKTALLGNYFGIFKNEVLVAVTGERMKMDDFTEVSAVCTMPEHTGHGYARQLLTHTTNQIFAEGKIPYLHVAETNEGAIKLYQKLGFTTRRTISAWNIEKIPNYR